MKKIVLMTALFVASLSANAQFEPGTFSIHPKIGFGVSTLTNTEDIEVEMANHLYQIDKMPKVGVAVGLEFEYQAMKWLGLAAGLNYVRQGTGWENYKLKVDGVKFQSLENELKLGYINLPIVANFYVVKGLALKTGVQMGFLTDAHFGGIVRATAKHDKTKVYNLTEVSTNMRDNFKKFDIAIPVGISYEFKHHFVIDARYNFGLIRVNDIEERDGNRFNRSFQMTFGYKFALGKGKD